MITCGVVAAVAVDSSDQFVGPDHRPHSICLADDRLGFDPDFADLGSDLGSAGLGSAVLGSAVLGSGHQSADPDRLPDSTSSVPVFPCPVAVDVLLLDLLPFLVS